MWDLKMDLQLVCIHNERNGICQSKLAGLTRLLQRTSTLLKVWVNKITQPTNRLGKQDSLGRNGGGKKNKNFYHKYIPSAYYCHKGSVCRCTYTSLGDSIF